jgi:hypothetical protein
MKENLSSLSAELLYQYMHDSVLPKLAKPRAQELKEQQEEFDKDEEFGVGDLLKENGLTKLYVSTVYRWMRKMGFKFMARKKCYYIDTHEKPEN